jgi:hypothetical protein
MNQLIVSSVALFAAGARISGCTPRVKETKKPNILFIFSDDTAYSKIVKSMTAKLEYESVANGDTVE